jgi:NADH-quinone oxidoreductase subunit L
MTRQMAHVFFGAPRREGHAHESPAVMTVPLGILAAGAVLFAGVATPAWPWFHGYLSGHGARFDLAALGELGFLKTAVLSVALAAVGIGLGWALYFRKPLGGEDVLARKVPRLFGALAGRLWVDELYDATVVRGVAALSAGVAWWDRNVWGGLVALAGWLAGGAGAVADESDRQLVNGGFDRACDGLRDSGGRLGGWHTGNVRGYLRVIGLAVFGLLIFLGWWGR